MFSVLVNYYNDRNLEQAMDLGMENAMQQVELRLLSVIGRFQGCLLRWNRPAKLQRIAFARL